ncbi:MAG: ROK family protein [Eubacterium sp.]|nr:ROK family protein [Eubacterium sp.]
MRIAVIDIGGTSIKSGMWEDHEMKEVRETNTNAAYGGAYVMQTTLEILRGYQDFQAIGISTAGQVDTKHGTILYANDNIPGYTGTRIKETVENTFRVPAAVLNDVNSAAIGEAFYGAGKDQKDFLCLTYGTGVGGAMILNGEIYMGAGYSAGEFGGIITHPEDRNWEADRFSGCYERYASTTALVKLVNRQFPELKNGRDIFASKDVPEVGWLIDQWIMEIVYGLITLTHIFNPSLIVLGGGIMEQEYVVRQVREKLEEQIIPSFRNVMVVPAQLGNMAGMLGAAREAQKHYEKMEKQ